MRWIEEGKAPRDNARYVVAAMPGYFGAAGLFDFYYEHSDMENTIKELKNDLDMDRTSCSRFEANQLRLLLTLTAYMLAFTCVAQRAGWSWSSRGITLGPTLGWPVLGPWGVSPPKTGHASQFLSPVYAPAGAVCAFLENMHLSGLVSTHFPA